MTNEDFELLCKDICPHCRGGAATRQRTDTLEWVHDTSVEIPGTLGRRQGHAFCLASHFRNQWAGKLDE